MLYGNALGVGNGEWGMGNGEGIILVDRFSGINVDPVSPHRKVKLKRMKPCDATRRDATRRDATRRDATRRDATRRDATRRDATRRDATRRDATRRDATIRTEYKYGAANADFRLRPYHVENTGSRPITEVKQRRARLVLGWVTAWEYRVL